MVNSVFTLYELSNGDDTESEGMYSAGDIWGVGGGLFCFNKEDLAVSVRIVLLGIQYLNLKVTIQIFHFLKKTKKTCKIFVGRTQLIFIRDLLVLRTLLTQGICHRAAELQVMQSFKSKQIN